jgi:hypothetical protein
MMVTGQKLDFVHTMCARRVNGESNGNSRRRQREQVKCGDHEARRPPPSFAPEQQHFSFLPASPGA